MLQGKINANRGVSGHTEHDAEGRAPDKQVAGGEWKAASASRRQLAVCGGALWGSSVHRVTM